MNHYSRLLPLAVVMLTAFKALGGNPQLVFVDGNDEYSVIQLADVKRITFDVDGLAVSAHTDCFFPYASLKKMVFDHEGAYLPAALSAPAIGPAAIRLQIDRHAQTLAVTGIDAPAPLRICTATGSLALAVREYSGGAVDISGLPAGIYIVITNHYSAKFIKK